MKTILKLVIVTIILLAMSCGPVVNPYKDYCEYQIVEKESSANGRWFKFRTEENITGRVYVLQIDWDNYEVGDYLHCN